MTAFVKCHCVLGAECQYNKGSFLEMSGALEPSLSKRVNERAYHFCETWLLSGKCRPARKSWGKKYKIAMPVGYLSFEVIFEKWNIRAIARFDIICFFLKGLGDGHPWTVTITSGSRWTWAHASRWSLLQHKVATAVQTGPPAIGSSTATLGETGNHITRMATFGWVNVLWSYKNSLIFFS